MDELKVSVDIGEMIVTGKTEVLKKTVIVPFCPPKTSQELTWDRTRPSMGDSVAVCIYELLHITVLYLFLELKKTVLYFQTFSFFKKIFTFV